jgi:hypothetical protein
MTTANLYLVFFYQEGPGGGCMEETREVLAYSAQDARLQVEITFEGRSPGDRYFRVTRIEPCVIKHKPQERRLDGQS